MTTTLGDSQAKCSRAKCSLRKIIPLTGRLVRHHRASRRYVKLGRTTDRYLDMAYHRYARQTWGHVGICAGEGVHATSYPCCVASLLRLPFWAQCTMTWRSVVKLYLLRKGLFFLSIRRLGKSITCKACYEVAVRKFCELGLITFNFCETYSLNRLMTDGWDGGVGLSLLRRAECWERFNWSLSLQWLSHRWLLTPLYKFDLCKVIDPIGWHL